MMQHGKHNCLVYKAAMATSLTSRRPASPFFFCAGLKSLALTFELTTDFL